tara:strand:+ start:799 stop:2112 length:1314 start_codon:yes stop_codon:yes gene_type:complete
MLKAFYKDSIFYGLFLFLGKFFTILSLPVITYFFPPKDFALADSYIVFINFIIPIVFLGLDSSVGRFYYEQKNKKKLILSTFLPGLFCSLIITCFLLFFSEMINSIYINQENSENFLPLVLLNIIPMYIILFTANAMKYAFKRWSFVFLSILNPILFSLSLIAMGYFFNSLDLKIYFLTFLFYNIVFSFYALYLIKDNFKLLNFDKSLLKDMYDYGIPFFFVSFISLGIIFSERYLLNNYFPVVIAGLYMFSYRIVNILTIFSRVLQVSWGPFAISNYKNENASKEYNKLLLFMTIFLNSLSCIVILFDKNIVNILANDNYHDSVQFLPFLLGANTFLILSSISNIGINITKKTTVHLKNYIFSFIIFISLFFLLKDQFLILSIAFSLFVSRMFLFIFQTLSSNKLYEKINFNLFIPLIITCLTSFSLFITKYKFTI